MKLVLQDTRNADAAPLAVEVRRRDGLVEVKLPHRTVLVSPSMRADGTLTFELDGRPVVAFSSQVGGNRQVALKQERFSFLVQSPESARKRARGEGHDAGALTSSMPGQVLKLLVEQGQEVRKGQSLLIIEAMKMEHELKAPFAGRVKAISCQAGVMVAPGVALVELEPLPSA